ncbi:MAG: AEC family transporter [Saccharospirillum sp.]|nr:AEC family transporter [Saccharospirillum sp.]
MLSVIQTIAPIFGVMAIGYVAVKTELMPKSAVPLLGRFVLFLALPALIFSTLAQTEVTSLIEPLYLLSYGSGSLLALMLGFGLSRLLWKEDLTRATVNGLGMSLSNSAFVGYPVLLQVYGTLPVAAFTMTLLVENLLIMPLVLIVLELSRALAEGGDKTEVLSRFLKRVATHPILLAIVFGIGFSLTGLSLPSVIEGSLGFLANASAGVALFVIGGSLVGMQIKGDIVRISGITFGKLALHPALVALMVWLLPPFDPELQRIAILMAALPMLSIYPVLAGNYTDPSRYAATLVAATLASFLSLSIVLLLLY